MKIRIKFSKHGNVCYIGHLDIMRYFQKVMRRANIPIRYSEGFSPHQIMSFAAPLGMGIESDCEYMDIEITEPMDRQDAIDALNRQMCPGIEILDWQVLDDKAKPVMSLIKRADYEVTFAKPPEADIDAFMKLESAVIKKKNKKGEIVDKDIRPLVYNLGICGNTLTMTVAQGIDANLKADEVLKYFDLHGGDIVRKEVYW